LQLILLFKKCAYQKNLEEQRRATRPLGCYEMMMNRQDPTFTPSPAAEVRYSHGEYKIVRNGSHVICAVTGAPIPLDDLKYWSVDLQEAYATTDAVLKRLRERKAPTIFGS
jgi:hypothetical protein